MFYGRFDTTVDDKWRMHIPSSLAREFESANLLLTFSREGCVRIYPEGFPFQRDYFPYLQKAVIRRGNRVVIPVRLRGSVSFHYGTNVTLAGYGGYLELWPRP